MKNKGLLTVIGVVLVVLAVVACLVFVFGDWGEEPSLEGQEINLEGTWVVVANYTNDVPVFVDNQYMIFTATEAAMYKDATSDAYAKSAYSVNEANQLELADISRVYKIAKKTNNCIRLYDGTENYMLLVRNSSSERINEAVTPEYMTGRWNVALKAEMHNSGEFFNFDETSLEYYRDEATLAAASEYTLENNRLTVTSMGLNMRCYKIGAEAMLFVEESGIVWELAK